MPLRPLSTRSCLSSHPFSLLPDFLVPFLHPSHPPSTSPARGFQSKSEAGPSRMPYYASEGEGRSTRAVRWAREFRRHQDARRVVRPDMPEGGRVRLGDRKDGSEEVKEAPRGSRSMVHQHLTRRYKPTPTELRDELRRRPSLTTSAPLTALSVYADRTGHTAVAETARVARRKVDMRYRDQGVRRRRGEIPDDTDSPWHLRGIRPHVWARARWPLVTRERVIDTHDLLSELHYRILAPTPVQPTLLPADAVEWAERKIKAERRTWRGRIEVLSEVLHLYIIYAGWFDTTGMEIMREILSLCPDLRPNRQTVHLLVQQVLWPHILDRREDENGDSERGYIPSNDPGAVRNLSEVLSTLYRQYHIAPGTETYRHILMFAGKTDDRTLGQIAIEGYQLASMESPAILPGEGDLAKWGHKGKRGNSWRNLIRVLQHKGWIGQDGNVVPADQVAAGTATVQVPAEYQAIPVADHRQNVARASSDQVQKDSMNDRQLDMEEFKPASVVDPLSQEAEEGGQADLVDSGTGSTEGTSLRLVGENAQHGSTDQKRASEPL